MFEETTHNWGAIKELHLSYHRRHLYEITRFLDCGNES